MRTTLTLIGISNLFLVWQSADYIWKDDTIKVGTVDLNETVQQTFEKVGILFDLARLSIILMSIKKLTWLTVPRINWALGFFCLVYVILGAAWEYVGYLRDKNPEDKEIEELEWTFLLIYSWVTNGLIPLTYITIYIVLRRAYERIFKSHIHVSAEDKKVIYGALRSLLLLFASICQLYIGRLVRDSYYYFDRFSGDGDLPDSTLILFPISKGVQVIGIVVALTLRLKADIRTFKDQQTQMLSNPTTQLDEDDILGGENLMTGNFKNNISVNSSEIIIASKFSSLTTSHPLQ